MGNLTFSKQQRLTSKKEIDSLFSLGKSFNLMPIRVIYSVRSHSNSGHKVLFSVPSRIFKKAVERNLLKRRMRESYRINQAKLDLSLKFNLAYIYVAKQILPYLDIEDKVVQSFQRLSNEVRA